MTKENTNEKAMPADLFRPSEPSDLPPPYVDPILIPARRPPSSTQHPEFSSHPGSRGKHKQKDMEEGGRDNDDKWGAGDDGDGEKGGGKEPVEDKVDDEFKGFWQFEME